MRRRDAGHFRYSARTSRLPGAALLGRNSLWSVLASLARSAADEQRAHGGSRPWPAPSPPDEFSDKQADAGGDTFPIATTTVRALAGGQEAAMTLATHEVQQLNQAIQAAMRAVRSGGPQSAGGFGQQFGGGLGKPGGDGAWEQQLSAQVYERIRD